MQQLISSFLRQARKCLTKLNRLFWLILRLITNICIDLVKLDLTCTATQLKVCYAQKQNAFHINQTGITESLSEGLEVKNGEIIMF